MRRAQQWHTRPVFVTSTFRDMHEERDILREQVLPALEERLRDRCRHLNFVDLRWGVETTSEADEEQRELLVLKVCLETIERCRPFLVAILGDRYGWVPPRERMRYAVEEAGFDTEIQGKSITALEIEYGVLDSPEQRSLSRFFFREPLPYDQMPPEVAAQYSDAHSPCERIRARVPRLDALKERIEDEMGDRVHHYSAGWDADEERVVGLEAFAEMVLEHLWADLEAEIPPLDEQEQVTWQDQERASRDEFVEMTARDFVGREQITADLLEFARSDDDRRFACVTGEAGSGKSALLAHFSRQLGEAPDDLLILSHFVGVTPRSTSVDALLLRWIEELADFLGEESPVEEGASADDIEEAFASLLGRAALQTRVVVVLDALNQLEASTRGEHMTWLPELWPENARLIASAIPCTASEALLQREEAREMPLPPVPPPEAEEIARLICARYHRTPPQRALDELVAKTGEDDRPAAGNPLWLTLAVEELNLLDQDDFEGAIERWPDLRGDEQLVRLLLSVIEEMPPEVEGLYEWMLAKTEEVWGEAWARGFANLLALSRAGWRETDLQALLPEVSGEEWDPGRFAGVRRSFRGHLVRRGADEQWDFAHAQTRPAIERRNLSDGAEVRRLHALIADYLEDLPRDDPLHESETMFHLIGADDPARAARYYGRDLTDAERDGATQRLAEPIIAGQPEEDGEDNPGLQWALSMLEAEGLEEEVTGRVCQNCIFYLRDAIENGTRLTTHLALLEPTRAVLERLASSDPGNAGWQRDLSVSHNLIGDVLRVQGDLSGALAAYEASLRIRERLASSDPGNAGWQRDLSISQANVGDIRSAQGDLQGALDAYRATLATQQRLASSDPGNAEWQRDLSVSHNKIGNVLRAQGDLSGALEAYESTHEILSRLASSDPGNAQWQRDLSVSHERLGDVLRAQGDLSGALAAYEASLEIAECLASSDPGNAQWQLDLAVSYYKLAQVAGEAGRQGEAVQHLLRCREVLRGMRERGMHLDPQLQQLLQQLEGLPEL